MKKLLVVLVAVVMLLMSACAPKTPDVPTEGGTDVQKKAVLLLPRLGDAGMNDAIHAGFMKACEENNLDGQYVEQGTDPAKFKALLLEAVESADMIIATAGYGMVDEMILSAQENPEIDYLVLDCPITQEGIEDLPNFSGTMCKQSELSFLAGYLAAEMSETGRIGMVFGMEYPTMSDFIIGYISGAKYANPDIKIALSASGSFSDQAAAKETALAQTQLKVDVIYAVGASSSYGTLEACKEKGIWGIGCDSDMAAPFIGKDEAQADVIISSALKDWGLLTYSWMDRVVNDRASVPWGTVEQETVASGGCKMVKNEIFEKQVPDELKQALLDLDTKFANGEIECPSYFTMEEAAYQEAVASVRIQ